MPYSSGSNKVELNNWAKIKREHPDVIVRSKTTPKGVVRLAIYGSGKNKKVIPISFLRKNPELSNKQLDLMDTLSKDRDIQASATVDPYGDDTELEKLGYIRYDKGYWKLTPKGRSAFALSSPHEKIDSNDEFWLIRGKSGGENRPRSNKEIAGSKEYELYDSDFSMNNPSNFSDLIKMSLSDYNRRTVENAAGEALIDREITQHQYNYIMNILDERESIRAYSKNPTPKSYLNRINRLKATFRVAYATNDFNTIDKLRDEAIDIMDDAVADNDLNDHEMRMVLNVAGPLSQSDNFESFQINPSYNTKVIFISVLSLIILRLFTNAK